jgi:multiple sugar transport system substrate-binding protein
MKKTYIVLLLTVLVVPCLLAEGTQEAERTTREDNLFEVVVFRDNPGQHIPTRELVNQWSEQNNIDVKITIAGHSTRQQVNTTALEGGSGPDIIMMTNFEPYIYEDGLLDVSDLARDIGRENGGWFPIAEQSARVHGVWRALPVYNYSHMMLYRKDILRMVGASVPDTWTEFRDVLAKIKNSRRTDITPLGVSIGRSFDGQQFLISVILSHGGKVLSDDASRVVFDSPETLKALNYVIGLYRDGFLDQTSPGWDDGTNNQAMLADRIAFTFNSNSIKLQAVSDFPEMNPKIGLAVYPAGPVERVSNPYAMSYGIRKSSKFPEESKELLRFLFEHDNYAKVLRETEGSVGVTLKGFTDLAIWDKEDYDVNLEAMSTARLFAQPSAESSEVYNSYIIVDMISDVLVNGMAPEKAVERAAKRMEEIYFGG